MAAAAPLLLSALLVLACGPLAAQQRVRSARQRPAAIETPQDLARAEQACRDWAAQVEAGARRQDPKFIIDALDGRRLTVRTLPKGASPAELERTADRIRAGLMQMTRLLCAEFRLGGTYKLVALYRRDGAWQALFRVVTPKAGFNYHEFLLDAGRDGRVAGVDVYIALNGEYLSTTMARAVGSLMTAAMNLDAKTRDASLARINRAEALASAGKELEADEVLEQLPPSFLKTRSVYQYRLHRLLKDDSERFAKVLEQALKQYPNEPCFELTGYSYFVTHNQFDRAQRALERLRPRVLNDPYLRLHLANLMIRRGDQDAARKEIDQVIADEPGLRDAYEVKVDICLAQLDFQAVAEGLDNLERLGLTLPDLDQLEPFALFVKSEACRQWRQRRAEAQTKAKAAR